MNIGQYRKRKLNRRAQRAIFLKLWSTLKGGRQRGGGEDEENEGEQVRVKKGKGGREDEADKRRGKRKVRI